MSYAQPRALPRVLPAAPGALQHVLSQFSVPQLVQQPVAYATIGAFAQPGAAGLVPVIPAQYAPRPVIPPTATRPLLRPGVFRPTAPVIPPLINPAAAAAAAAEAQLPVELLEPSNALPTAHSVCFHPRYPDEPLLVTGDSDGTITLLRTTAPRKVYQLFAGSVVAPCLATAATDDFFIATVGGELRAYEWSALTEAMDSAAPMDAAPAPADGKEKERTERLMLTAGHRTLYTNPQQGELLVSVAVCGGQLYVGDSCGQLCAFSLPTTLSDTVELTLGPVALHHGGVTAIAQDGEGRLVTGSDDGTVRFSCPKGEQQSMQLVPCVMVAATASADGGAAQGRGRKRSADGAAKKNGAAEEANGVYAYAVNALDVDPDGLWLAVGGDVPYVSLLNLLTHKVQKILPLPHAEWRARSVRFHRSTLLVGVDDAAVLVYSLSGQLLDTKTPACDSAHGITVAPNGHWAVTGRNTGIEVFRDL